MTSNSSEGDSPKGGALISDLATATVTVASDNLAEVTAVYQNLLGYEMKANGPIGPQLAATWGVTDHERLFTLLGAPGERRGLVRLIAGESEPPAPYSTLGWSTMEITVRDVDTLTERVRASPHFRINGEPEDLGFGGTPPHIRASQAVGPAGEQVYLTQVLAEKTELPLPPPGAEAGPVFVAVILCTDPATQMRPYVEVLGMEPYWRFETPIGVIAAEAGLPTDHEFELTVLQGAGATKIEVDRFPESILTRRDKPEGELLPGFGLASFYVTDFDQSMERMAAAAYTPIAAPVHVDAAPYNGSRTVSYFGELGEQLELIEDESGD